MSALFGQFREQLEFVAAAEVADLFLSPFISLQMLNESTAEQGPAMWIVNRSDVYSVTLEKFLKHPLEAIRLRAQEKLDIRSGKSAPLPEPEFSGGPEEVPHHSVEDVLGHPMVDLKYPFFYSHSLNEDERASSALSLCRRLLEYPLTAIENLFFQENLLPRMSNLLRDDPSPYVRTYAARLPIFNESLLRQALTNETNPRVMLRLLQNPALTQNLLDDIQAKAFPQIFEEMPVRFVLSLDERLSPSFRKFWLSSSPRLEELSHLIALELRTHPNSIL